MILRPYNADDRDHVLEIRIPQSLCPQPDKLEDFRAFLQMMANRRTVGQFRYGDPTSKQRYMTRLGKELAAYKVAGNIEQLVNIAVYAYLEMEAPENPKHHFDPTAESITRAEMGGNLA